METQCNQTRDGSKRGTGGYVSRGISGGLMLIHAETVLIPRIFLFLKGTLSLFISLEGH